MSNISQERSWWSPSLWHVNRIPMLIDHMSILKPIENKNKNKNNTDPINKTNNKQKFTVIKNVIPDEYQNLVQNVLSDMSINNFKDCKEIEFNVPNKLLFVASDSRRSNLSKMKRVVDLDQMSKLDTKMNLSTTNHFIDNFGSSIGVSFATIMAITLKPLSNNGIMEIKKFEKCIGNKKLVTPAIITVGAITSVIVSSSIKLTKQFVNNKL
jgi:hypothetical protein